MLLKIVTLFLIFMIVMGAVQKLLRGRTERQRKAIDRLRCPVCRRIEIARNPSPCARPDCEYR
jgi:cytochrome c-type biogenesis protein CcmH/NrfF